MQRAHALKVFRDLHRTCRIVFDGDVSTFKTAKDRIRAEFRANQMERDPQKIAELLKYAEDVEMLLRTTVIQVEYDENTSRCKLKLRKGLAYQSFDDSPPTPKSSV
ncbi:hypothetical protein EG68_00667 [Paragonimus skrjabini miyazakii]|uniref:Complex III assembly factor LYRM7 n=1 Tax=Paragonimus skrjabini miyazakii TaxID=59628 RepID=A0A8S9Z9A5_9TREM|nr:hypothetical protein EG68_00667 [Paragonimus skrjabini miyazakii]